MKCKYCGQEIYFGPRNPPKLKSYQKLDTTWHIEIWRHASTQMAQCNSYATPIEEETNA